MNVMAMQSMAARAGKNHQAIEQVTGRHWWIRNGCYVLDMLMLRPLGLTFVKFCAKAFAKKWGLTDPVKPKEHSLSFTDGTIWFLTDTKGGVERDDPIANPFPTPVAVITALGLEESVTADQGFVVLEPDVGCIEFEGQFCSESCPRHGLPLVQSADTLFECPAQIARDARG